MLMIQLTQIISDGETVTEEGEDDVVQTTRLEDQTMPLVIIDPAKNVRSFTPRKNGNGTRIVFLSGAAAPVKEAFVDVLAKLRALPNQQV